MYTVEDIYQLLKDGDIAKKKVFLEYLPNNSLKSTAGILIDSENKLSSLLAFGSLLPVYCQGAHCKVGKTLSLALYYFGKELFIGKKEQSLYLMTVMGFACNYLAAIINLSKFKQGYDFIENELPFWEIYENDLNMLNKQEQADFLNNLKTILVSKINILIHLNKLDEAWELANTSSRVEGNWSSDIELNRLRNVLKTTRASAGEIDSNADQRKKAIKDNQEKTSNTILESLKKAIQNSGIDSTVIDNFSQKPNLDPFSEEGINKLEEILTQGEQYIQDTSSEENELSVRQVIRRASEIFVNRIPEIQEINKSLIRLKSALLSAKKLNNNVLINDALYGQYLCYSRLNKSSEAADQLILLRQNLEKTRKGITNPLERGGIFQTYPYLFYSSVEHLYKSNRFDEMIDAIEASKGRTITDMLEKQANHSFTDINCSSIRARITPLLIKEKSHYITFHVDDDCTYVCLITKRGELFAEKVPIGKTWLQKWYSWKLNDPVNWNSGFRKVNVISDLFPFVEFLEKHTKSGNIEKNDHICYSADHLLYLFPLHFLKINGASIIELNTISRIHNAGQLIYLLSAEANRPSNCFSMVVPSTDDLKNQDVVAAFNYSSELLKKLFPKNFRYLKHSEADINSIINNRLNNHLVHFSAHGFFPANDNPFDNSGILLADKGKLPTLHLQDPNYKYCNDQKHLLSPKRLLVNYEKSDFTNSHISLQACVAGYAKEGIGGDALGIEWAFLQKGARSMISTNWNIDITNANAFYEVFYNEWITNGRSKAFAHKKAVLTLKNSDFQLNGIPEEYFWAGYSLIGDWR